MISHIAWVVIAAPDPMEEPRNAGYSNTPLAKKLGIKEGSNVLLVGAPGGYLALLDPLPSGVTFGTRLTGSTDIVHVFTTTKEELQILLPKYRAGLKPNGAVWVSWPKKASRIPTDLTDNVVREVALPLGFVDIKICAVSEIWSGQKLVIRRALR